MLMMLACCVAVFTFLHLFVRPKSPVVINITTTLLALLALVPLITGLDLVLHFLPSAFPAIQNLHSAHPIGQAIWVLAGIFGTITLRLLSRNSVIALITSLLFCACYMYGASEVWLQFTAGYQLLQSF